MRRNDARSKRWNSFMSPARALGCTHRARTRTSCSCAQPLAGGCAEQGATGRSLARCLFQTSERALIRRPSLRRSPSWFCSSGGPGDARAHYAAYAASRAWTSGPALLRKKRCRCDAAHRAAPPFRTPGRQHSGGNGARPNRLSDTARRHRTRNRSNRRGRYRG